MAQQWHTATFVKIENATPTTRRFWLQVQDVEHFDFIAGQFVTLDLPIGEKPKERWRSYSIASAPSGDSVFELVIVLVEGGAGTDFLFNKTTIGDAVKFMGPLGKFVLPEQLLHDVCFVCTGTGVAPFRSMIIDICKKRKSYKNIYLIFGTRTITDILYYNELSTLAAGMPDFHYIVTLSRESASDWKGGKGYVHSIYEEIFADKREADFYLCGWRNMIDEARRRLHELGYDNKHIHVEIYG